MVLLALTLACIPLVSASPILQYTGYGPGLFGIGDYNALSVQGNGYSTGFYTSPDNAYVYSTSTGPGLNYGVSFSRNYYTQYNTYPDQNMNYRTIGYGNWQLQSASVSCADCGYNAYMGFNPYTRTYGIDAQIGGYPNSYGPGYLGYTQNLGQGLYDTGMSAYGWTQPYYPSTPSAYTGWGSSYYS